MANEYMNVYGGNPTAGQRDGTAISLDGTQLSPLTVSLDASTNESKKIPLALRSEAGYTAANGATVGANNDINNRWKYSLTENGTYSDTVIISSGISSVNTIFYAQASSSSLENPARDTSVSIKVEAVIDQA